MARISEGYPWFKKYENSLRDLLTESPEKRLPQALLWTGPEGLGLEDFVRENAGRFVSSSADILWVAPEATEGPIKVEQIRAVIEFMVMKTFSGTRRLVVIPQADRMNPNAQNALLKTLEEPAESAFVWLISSTPKRLLPTVISRCQRLSFLSTAAEAKPYFLTHFPEGNPDRLWDQAHFGPLRMSSSRQAAWRQLVDALKAKTSPLAIAAEHAPAGVKSCEWILDFFYDWISDWLRFQMGAEARVFRDETAWLQSYPHSGLRAERAQRWVKRLGMLKRAMSEGISLNPELMLEDVFIEWTAF